MFMYLESQLINSTVHEIQKLGTVCNKLMLFFVYHLLILGKVIGSVLRLQFWNRMRQKKRSNESINPVREDINEWHLTYTC